MSNTLNLVLFLSGACFFGVVLRLLMKNKIGEKISLVWLGGSLAILILSGMPQIIDTVAARLGIQYAPSLLFLCSTLVILLLILYLSIQISQLNDKIKELAQYMTIQTYEEGKRLESARKEIHF